MDITDRLPLRGIFEGLRSRVSALSRRAVTSGALASLNQKAATHRRKLHGVTLLTLSAVLGIWAQELAQNEAISSWLRTHPPSPKIWRHALESHGMTLLEDPRLLQKASRALPIRSDQEGQVWATADLNWIATLNNMYCVICDQPPIEWGPRGTGWDAFDPVLEQVAQAAATRLSKQTKKSQKSATPADPREIRY